MTEESVGGNRNIKLTDECSVPTDRCIWSGENIDRGDMYVRLDGYMNGSNHCHSVRFVLSSITDICSAFHRFEHKGCDEEVHELSPTGEVQYVSDEAFRHDNITYGSNNCPVCGDRIELTRIGYISFKGLTELEMHPECTEEFANELEEVWEFSDLLLEKNIG